MKLKFKFIFMLLLLISCLKAQPRSHSATDGLDAISCSSAAENPSFANDIQPILKKYCITCHSSQSPAGGIQLETYSDPSSLSSTLERWKTAGSQILKGSMPPSGFPSFSDCERLIWDRWLALQSQTESDADNPDSTYTLEVPLQRLSKRELENALSDLFGLEVANLLKQKLQSIPEDDKSGAFANLNWSLSPDHIRVYSEISNLTADLVKIEPKRLGKFEPCLLSQSIDDVCVKSFIKRFGLRVFRRPIKDNELEGFFSIYAEFPGTGSIEGIATLVRVFLQSPFFLYKLEIDGNSQPNLPNSYVLSDFELASRLSFMLIQSIPDSELLDLAARGELSDESVLHKQVERLLIDPRARDTVDSFFTQWLRLNSIPDLSYSAEFKGDVATDTLKNDAIAEALWFINHVIWEKHGSYKDLINSRSANFSSPQIAKIYGVDQPTGPGAIELPAESRRGLLTRAALLLSGHDEASPIHRGAFIRTQLLCDVLQSPDPQNLPPGSLSPPTFDPQLSTRGKWEHKTNSSVCQGCHSKMNPLGFALGNFDGLGRFVSFERVIDPNGQLANTLPIDATAVPELSPGDPVSTTGPLELSEMLATSSKAAECFVRQWFRFSFKRHETARDRQIIGVLMGELQNSGGGIRGMILKTLLLPENRRRAVEE